MPTVDYRSFSQGSDNACWIASALSALAFQRPAEILAMIEDLGDDRYRVSPPGCPGESFDVAPASDEASSSFSSDWVWAKAIHMALGQKLGAEVVRNEKVWNWDRTITLLTGNGTVHNTNFSGLGFGTILERVRTKLDRTNRGKIAIASTANHQPSGSAAQALAGPANDDALRSGHVYAVFGFDGGTDRVRMRNPCGNTNVPAARKDPTWGPGEFWLTVAEFEKNLQVMSYERE